MSLTLDDIRAALTTPDGPDPLARDPEVARRALVGQHLPMAEGPPALAAVAAVLTRDLDLLFIERAHRPGDPWSGHVSFPGGRAEPTDADTLQTAMRETHEELGLDLGPAEVLGALEDVPTAPHLPPLLVRPWVFFCEPLPPARPNHEVAAVHLVPLRGLLGGEGRGTFDYPWQGHRVQLPQVELAPGVRLWGMTLRMVDDLLHRLDGRGQGIARPLR